MDKTSLHSPGAPSIHQHRIDVPFGFWMEMICITQEVMQNGAGLVLCSFNGTLYGPSKNSPPCNKDVERILHNWPGPQIVGPVIISELQPCEDNNYIKLHKNIMIQNQGFHLNLGLCR